MMLKNDFESQNFGKSDKVVHNFGKSDKDMIYVFCEKMLISTTYIPNLLKKSLTVFNGHLVN